MLFLGFFFCSATGMSSSHAFDSCYIANNTIDYKKAERNLKYNRRSNIKQLGVTGVIVAESRDTEREKVSILVDESATDDDGNQATIYVPIPLGYVASKVDVESTVAVIAINVATAKKQETNMYGYHVIQEHYIGRYELGDNDATSSRSCSTGFNNIPVEVQEKIDYNYIIDLCKELAGENENVVTTMIWGCMWDNTLIYLVVESGGKTIQ